MKKEQIYFLLFLLLTLVLIIFLDFVKPTSTGKIEKISFYPDHVTLYLENYSTQIYFANNSQIKLEKDMEIKIFGKKENSLNKSIIFADKILLLQK